MSPLPKINKEPELWVTNINRRKSITIHDLHISLKPGESINLFSRKLSRSFTPMDVERSIESGSIKEKSEWIKIRLLAPNPPIEKVFELSKRPREGFNRSTVKLEHKEYEELDFDQDDDLKFAEETADAALYDHMPSALAVDEKYKKMGSG